MTSRRQGRREGIIQKQGGNVVTYFCTPQGHVLHFVVGPVSSEKLLESAQWSHWVSQLLLKKSGAGISLEDRRSWMKFQHDTHLSHEKDVLGKITEWLSGKGLDDQAKVIRAKKSFRDAYKAIQGTVGDQGHQLLREQPLPHLSEIEALVFEKLAGQVFSRRSHQLRERILKNIQDGRPTLLMVANLSRQRWTPGWNEAEVARKSEPRIEDFLPNNTQVRQHLHAFHAEVLTSGELTAVVAALDQPPIPSPVGTWPAYVILDRQGEIAHAIPNTHYLSVLARFMKKHVADENDKTGGQTKSELSVTLQEQLARSDLRLAKYLLSKRPEKARERLKKIVVKYPDTEVAADALWLLAQSK